MKHANTALIMRNVLTIIEQGLPIAADYMTDNKDDIHKTIDLIAPYWNKMDKAFDQFFSKINDITKEINADDELNKMDWLIRPTSEFKLKHAIPILRVKSSLKKIKELLKG